MNSQSSKRSVNVKRSKTFKADQKDINILDKTKLLRSQKTMKSDRKVPGLDDLNIPIVIEAEEEDPEAAAARAFKTLAEILKKAKAE
jgi:hypothetical protein